MSNSSMPTSLNQAITFLLISVLTGGCVKKYEVKVARYRPRSPSVTETIPRSGAYKVKWKVGDEFKAAPDTMRYFVEGTTVGFEEASDGTVIAVAGDQRLELGPFPRKAKYCCWYQRCKGEARFGRNLREATLAVLTGAGYVAGVAAVVAVEAYTNDDCDHNDYTHWR